MNIYEHFSNPTVRNNYLTYIDRLQPKGPYADPADILAQVIDSLSGKVPPTYCTLDQWLKKTCRLLVKQARWKFYHNPQACKTIYGLTTLCETPSELNVNASNLIDLCLPMLTPKQREVVRGIYFLNETKAEIARQMGCKAQSVEYLHQRALRRMKKILTRW